VTTIERRFADLEDVEVRDDEGGGIRFSGHAAVFNSLTDLGPFREQVAPGAFRRTISPQHADVGFLYNHQPDSIMARTTNGTLKLAEDRAGLATDAVLDPSDWDVSRLVPKMRAGLVTKMSFGFRVVKNGDEWEDHPEDGGSPIRTLREVELFDVSPVTFPAYDDTDAALRSIAKGALAVAETRGITCEHCIDDVVEIIRRDAPLPEETSPDEGELRDEAAPDAAPPDEEPTHATDRLILARKRLEYLRTTL